MYKLTILLLFLLVYNNAFAFNWGKCKRFLNRDNSLTGAAGFASTTSFFSSTGDCAAIGMKSEERAKVFYAFNYDKVLDDIARGNGEYYVTLTKLWECEKEFSPGNMNKIRNEYSELLRAKVEDQYEMIKDHTCSQRS